jgi:hypothetical protein
LGAGICADLALDTGVALAGERELTLRSDHARVTERRKRAHAVEACAARAFSRPFAFVAELCREPTNGRCSIGRSATEQRRSADVETGIALLALGRPLDADAVAVRRRRAEPFGIVAGIAWSGKGPARSRALAVRAVTVRALVDVEPVAIFLLARLAVRHGALKECTPARNSFALRIRREFQQTKIFGDLFPDFWVVFESTLRERKLVLSNEAVDARSGRGGRAVVGIDAVRGSLVADFAVRSSPPGAKLLELRPEP